jgi:D-glycero-alpha-D-manno-heptose-7-phosphate kinase
MITSRTPFRVSLFSGGSDMPSFYNKEDGAALSFTIDKYVYVSIHNTITPGIRTAFDTVETFNKIEEMNHPITQQALAFANIEGGISISSISDITTRGSGLGSSSAFTVGLANCLETSKHKDLSLDYLRSIYTPEHLARMACVIEMNLCQFPCGKQDQYAAAYGGLNLFTFKSNGSVSVSSGFVSPYVLDKLESKLLLVYSGVGRSANGILQKQQSAMDDTEKFKLVQAGRDKAYKAAKFLENGDIGAVGEMLHSAWVDKKALVNEISENYFDIVYDKAIRNGAIGGKLLGAGGGGFFIFFVPENRQEECIRAITTDTKCQVLPFTITKSGSKIISVDV